MLILFHFYYQNHKMGETMEQILFDIRHIIEEARGRVARSINHERTMTYWRIGERIFIEEQDSKQRADYGKYLLKNLSEVLVNEFGDGFSRRQLELMRQFYLTFPIANAVSSQLTWTHYKVLIRIDDPDKRTFFIAESIKNAWNVPAFGSPTFGGSTEGIGAV
jgi:hypothetical protein